jgi:cytidylate kinase
MRKHFIVAIDGPAGSGKSTVSRITARRLKLQYIDTGAMYRALTLKAIRKGLDLGDESALTALARGTVIGLRSEGDLMKVSLDGEDVSARIRTPELTNKVKYVARIPGVREEMVEQQREIGRRVGAVLEGRDIGTVVFPNADYKFYLDADVDERARRRCKELKSLGEDVNAEQIRKDVIARDRSDMERSVGALKKAPDAFVIDTTRLTIEQVVQKILSIVKRDS